MKDHSKNEVKVGLTVIAGLLILLLGFSVFKNWSVGKAQYEIRMHFPTSSGLQAGDQVSVNGVRAGAVSAVELQNGGVLVTALIDQSIEVYREATPVIQMLELMGGKKIEIRQGGSGSPADASFVIQGTVDPDIAGALGALGAVQGNIQNISVQADSLLRSINSVMGDKEFIASLKETVTNLHALSGELRSYATRNGANLDRLTGNLTTLTSRADTLLAELPPRLGRTLDNTDRLLGQGDTLLGDVRSLLTDIRDSRGLLHSVVFDTALVRRFDGMLIKLDSLSNIIINGEFTTNISLF
ncbi:MAG: MlaD family protein [Bacteroidia bacterium]|nr:MlaD family protein [Bacteroidia bacterium]